MILQKSISFESLEFIEPFSQISENSFSHRGKVVFLKESHGTPGILVLRYLNEFGAINYVFRSVQLCLCEAARKAYNRASKKMTNITFALIPAKVSKHEAILRSLQRAYSRNTKDNHFELLKPWLDGKRTDQFDTELLNYRRPFTVHDGLSRFSMYDYNQRNGFYFIREKHVKENKLINVYVGKSEGALPGRIRSKFYPNPHLYYQEIPGELEYYIAPIEVKRSMFSRHTSFEENLLRYEGLLMNLLATRDNKWKRFHENTDFNSGFKPFLKDDEEGF